MQTTSSRQRVSGIMPASTVSDISPRAVSFGYVLFIPFAPVKGTCLSALFAVTYTTYCTVSLTSRAWDRQRRIPAIAPQPHSLDSYTLDPAGRKLQTGREAASPGATGLGGPRHVCTEIVAGFKNTLRGVLSPLVAAPPCFALTEMGDLLILEGLEFLAFHRISMECSIF
jgi:hypothetical protein